MRGNFDSRVRGLPGRGNENSENKEKRRTLSNLDIAIDYAKKQDIILTDRHNLKVLYSNVDCLTNKMNDINF